MTEENQKTQFSINIKDEQVAKQPLEEDDSKRFIIPSEQNGYMTTHTVIKKMIGVNAAPYIEDRGYIDFDLKDTKEKRKIYLEIINNPNTVLLGDITLTVDDFDLIDIIGSIYDNLKVESSNGFIKVQHLINVRNSKLSSSTNKKTEKEIFERIQELASVTVRLETKEHQVWNAASKKKKQTIQDHYQGQLIPVETLVYDGHYYLNILASPIFYRYANDTGQLSYWSREQRDLTTIYEYDEYGEVINEKPSSIKRISDQINTLDYYFRSTVFPQLKRTSDKQKYVPVNFETIYNFLKKDNPSLDISRKKSRINESIFKLLDTYREKGEIQGYRTTKNGNKYHQIKIIGKK